MNYWELRKEASKLIPRKVELVNKDRHGMKEKGRKSNYQQYSIAEEKTVSIQRLLDTDSMNSFAEVSLRAQSCPMPLNIDVWDGLQCVEEGALVNTKRGKIPIEEILVGDEVLTMNEFNGELEWKSVLKSMRSEKSDMVELDTEVGSIRLTWDHPVFTDRGWIRAGELKSTDLLYTWE